MSNVAEKEVTQLQRSPEAVQVIDPMPFQFKSTTIGKLAEALAKAQAEIRNAAKDKDNPFFKSTYADLASVWDACREPLSKNGLSVTQPLSFDDRGRVVLTTLLLHSSGEWIGSQLPVNPVKNDPQSLGSAITYMRRFALASIVGVAPAEKPTEEDGDDSDDDGNAASGLIDKKKNESNVSVIKPKQDDKSLKPKPTSDQLVRLFTIGGDNGYSKENIKVLLKKIYNLESTKDLSMAEYDEFCKILAAKRDTNPSDSFDNFV